jgi:hypothetical protein
VSVPSPTVTYSLWAPGILDAAQSRVTADEGAA